MPPDNKDMARLWDILDAARAIVAFMAGITYESFLQDRKTRNAVERNLEIIGEATRAISAQTRLEYPEIPWKSMIALRNIIAHEYGDILYENIWRICGHRLPVLIQQLESLGVDESPS